MQSKVIVFFSGLFGLLLQVNPTPLDLPAVLDRYGYPTAILCVVLWFVWNRQKKADKDSWERQQAADKERNDLINRNNALTVQLIEVVKQGNACHFIGSDLGCKFEK